MNAFWRAVVLLLVGTSLAAQSQESAESHVAAAKALAANEPTALINLCTPPQARGTAPARTGQPPATQPQAPPDRSTWAREPVKVFDNLYYVGEQEYSAWAVTTSAGIIIIDAIYDYSVEEQIAGGLKKLGLDPSQIKYVVISHAHRDHVGGAWYLQERFGARVMMTAADWDLLERNTAEMAKGETGHRRHRRPTAYARRHDADVHPHARPYAGHHVDARAGEG